MKLKKKIVIAFMSASILLPIAGNTIGVYADDTKNDKITQSSNAKISSNIGVKAIIPENNLKDTSYFDLMLKPSEEQTIYVNVSNSSDKEVAATISIEPATTNLNGIVTYQASKEKKDPTMVNDFKKVVTSDSEIKIPANGSVKVPIQIKMPDKEFQGIMAGGITVKQTDQNKDTKTSGTGVINEFQYMIAILLQNNPNTIQPQVEFGNFAISNDNGRTAALTTIRNISSNYIYQAAIDSKITSLDNQKVNYTQNKDGLQFAPNSQFNWPTYFNSEGSASGNTDKLKAGKYKIEQTVYSTKDEKGKYTRTIDGKTTHYKYQWKMTREFEIKKDEVKKLEAKDLTIVKEKSFFILPWILLASALVVGFFAFFIKRRKDKKNKEDEIK